MNCGIRAACRAPFVCAAVVACFLACEPAAGAAAPAADGSTSGEIRGSVVDHTPPAHPVAGQPVRLEIVEPAANSTRDTTTDSQGRFVFPGLPLGGVRVFLVQVEYGGVPYTARVVLTAAAPVQDVPVSVFVATADRSSVRGTIAFAVVEAMRGALRVSVIERLSNETDQAVAVTDRDPLVFPLPTISPVAPGTEPIRFVGGWREPRVTNGAITDAIPVLPGATEVAYAFGVEPRARTATLRWEFPYGATDVEILTDPSITVSGEALHAGGIVTERERRYARWSGGPVRSGDAVSMRLDGVPVSVDVWPQAGAGGLALALACGLAVALRRRPRGT